MDKARYSNEAPEEVTRESLIAIADSEAPEAVTRESLIAISYSEPDKNLTSNLSSGKLNGETVGKALDSDEEKFRTELISISYAQSPEAEGLPVPMGELAN